MRSSRVWQSGIIGPPDSPCITRNSTSRPSDGARPHSAEHRANSTMATQKVLTVPNRWASQPVSGTMMASATE